MPSIFPSPEWLKSLEDKLNSDDKYAQIARNWEGDLCLVIQPEGNLKEGVIFYLDLWHGKCRGTEVLADLELHKPTYTLRAGYNNYAAVVQGRLDPMQALLTRKLDVQGSMVYLMRHVPTILDFVRCAREVTSSTL